jgi:glycosyltransferase involved in cell wall biosynthesis
MTRIRTADPVYESLSSHDIVCIGTAEWRSTLWTNQQHLMSRLATTNRVVYTESLGLRRPTVTGRDIRRLARRLAAGLRGPRRVDGLWVVSPLVVPSHGSAAVRRLNNALLRGALRWAARKAGLGRPLLWTYNPHAHELIDTLGASLVVYHCVDDVAAQEGVDRPSFAAAERAVAARADLVLVSARPLEERMRALGARRVVYLPNVADVEHFAAADSLPEPAALGSMPRPRLLFAGAVAAKKLDVSLLAELARRRPEWSLVLVGPVGEGDPRGDLGALRDLPNVLFAGSSSFDDLPAWIGAADVCLIPYLHNAYTASVFPMKVYEYLAAGRPVVSTRLPALQGVEGLAFADGADEFEAQIDAALREDSEHDRQRRRDLAEAHSWSARVREIAQLVSDCERARERVSTSAP